VTIVLDILLPELDGLAFCRILRREQFTPIIFVTARGGELDRIGLQDADDNPGPVGQMLEVQHLYQLVEPADQAI
jgi:CheY-like chemotaxis protein